MLFSMKKMLPRVYIFCMRMQFCSQRLPQEQTFLCKKCGLHKERFAVAEIYFSSQTTFSLHKENITAENYFSPLNKFVSHEEFDVAGRYFVANISSFLTFS